MQRKKIALLASILMVTLVVGVYAVILSNTLTTSWTLKAGTPLNLYWAAPYWYPSAELNRGEWIYATIGLKNTGLATYDLVSPKFKIWTDASGLPTNCIKIEYWDGDSWEDMTGVITGWGSATLYGYFGPSTGFPVDPPYDEVTSFRIMFDGDAPLVGYGFEAWVVQV